MLPNLHELAYVKVNQFKSPAGLEKSELSNTIYCNGRRRGDSVRNLVTPGAEIGASSLWWSIVACRQNGWRSRDRAHDLAIAG